MIYSLPPPEPLLADIVKYSIATQDPDYDLSWIEGELILRINCEDGICLIYYVPGKFNKRIDEKRN